MLHDATTIDATAGSGFSRLATMVLFECLFWVPLWFVPLVARATRDPLLYTDIAACVSFSAAFWVIGTYFGRFQPIYRSLLYVVLALGSLTVTGMALSNSGSMDALTALAIIDTNRSEATEFVTGKFDLLDVVLCSLLLVPVVALAIQMRWRLFFGRVRLAFSAIIVLFIVQIAVKDARAFSLGYEPATGVLSWFLSYPVDHYPPLQPYNAMLSAYQIRRQITQLASTARPLRNVTAVDPPSGKPRVYVVVFGEALARRHMHLYGYPRDTTPEMDKLAQAGQLLVFRHVVTAHAMTVPSFYSMLPFQPGRRHDGQTLIDIFNGAGFKTYWISNQYQYGAFESGVSLMTASATVHMWLNQPLEGQYQERRNFDTVVLKPLRKIVQQDKGDKMIFIHLLGSHYLYSARFPKTAAYFDGTSRSRCRTADQNKMIDEYDDSVRFNDALIGQIIDTMRRFDGESFVLYFPDHGEEVFDWRDFAGHGDQMLSPYLAQIPFVLWLSDAYRSAHPAFTARITRATDRPFILSNLLDTLTDLARLSFPGTDERRDLFSNKYEPYPRITAGQDYDAFKANWAPDNAHADGVKLLSCGESAQYMSGNFGAEPP